MRAERRRLRLLANVDRLTGLPEYRRAARLRTLSAVVAITLLTVIFGAAVVAAACLFLEIELFDRVRLGAIRQARQETWHRQADVLGIVGFAQARFTEDRPDASWRAPSDLLQFQFRRK